VEGLPTGSMALLVGSGISMVCRWWVVSRGRAGFDPSTDQLIKSDICFVRHETTLENQQRMQGLYDQLGVSCLNNSFGGCHKRDAYRLLVAFIIFTFSMRFCLVVYREVGGLEIISFRTATFLLVSVVVFGQQFNSHRWTYFQIFFSYGFYVSWWVWLRIVVALMVIWWSFFLAFMASLITNLPHDLLFVGQPFKGPQHFLLGLVAVQVAPTYILIM